MRFDELERFIPWLEPSPGFNLLAKATKLPLTEVAGASVTAYGPGQHWEDTLEEVEGTWRHRKGGDFLINVTDPGARWKARSFTHPDLLLDIERKARADRESVLGSLIPSLVRVVAEGSDPLTEALPEPTVGLHPRTLLVASQALALCEHRRFLIHAPTSGRALPARLAIGVAYDIWTAAEASARIKSGKHNLLALRDELGLEPSFSEILGRPLTSEACRELRDIVT